MKFVSTLAVAFCIVAGAAVSSNAQEANRIFYVKVDESTELQGQIIDVTDLKVTTAFGEVTIPFDKIEGIKMKANKDQAVIAFINGDMVTGKVQMDELHLKTSWGKAHINASSIDAISGSQFGSFFSDPSGGWRFTRGTAPRPGQNQMMNQGSNGRQPMNNRANTRSNFSRGGN